MRKTVTILVCDVVGSTEMGEKLDAEVVRATMARYFDVAGPLIERYGGTVEKFIGDAVMAVFGVPRAHEDDAERAVRAAHELRRELDGVKGVQVRIGVATGEAMTGAGQTLGSGDVFNLASRLQAAASAGDVLIANETRGRIGEAVVVEAVPPLTLKGRAERVQAWRLVHLRNDADALTGRPTSTLVGRASELRLLREDYERCVADQRCNVVTVLGEAGVGKSRLAAEFTASLDAHADGLVGHCPAYGEGITLWPVAEIVRAAAGIFESDDRSTAAAKIARMTEGTESQLAAGHVAAALGFTEAVGSEEFDWAVRRVFEGRAAVRPQVLVFEDVHWAKPALLNLVEYLARWSQTAPILIICLGRPDFLEMRPGWGGDLDGARTIWVDGLTDGDCLRLIEDAAPALSDVVRKRIVKQAEGNPLFAEQIAAMLIGDPKSVEIPASVGALLQARIDHLDAEKSVIAAGAAVEGRVFHRSAVAELIPEHVRRQLGEHLLGLMRSRVIIPAEGRFVGEDAYQFCHALVRDAAYDALPKRTRFDLHERLAAWLEERAGTRIGEHEEIIGYHLEQAYRYRLELDPGDEYARDLAQRTARHLWSSAGRAQARGDIDGARGLLERCLEISTGADEALTRMLLAETVAALGRYPDALRLAAEVERAAAALQDRGLELRAQLTRIVARTHTDPTYKNAHAQNDAENLLAEFEARCDREGRDRTLVELGRLAWYDGQVSRAFAISQRVYADAGQMSPRDRTSVALGLFGWAHEGSIPMDERFRVLDQARTVLGEGALGEAVTKTLASAILGLAGSFESARACAADAWQAWADLGNPVRRSLSYEIIGGMERLAGNLDEAAALFRQGHELLTQAGETLFSSSAAVNLADTLCDLGEFDEAEELIEGATNLAAVAEQDMWLRSSLRMIHARVLSSRGEHTTALLAADEAVALGDGSEYGDWACSSHEVRGQVLAGAGRIDDARIAYETALRRYARSGIEPAASRLRARIASLGGG